MAFPDDEEVPNGDDDANPADEADEGADQGDGDESDGPDDEADAEESEGSDAPDDDGEEGSSDVDGPDRETPKRRSANDVIREQKKARKASDERAAKLEREIEEARRETAESRRRVEEVERRTSERTARETAEQEAARLELMSESERIAHYRQKDKAEHAQEMNGVKFQIWDSTDRNEFRQLKREDPLVAKVADKVEAEFAKLSAQGRPVSREILAELFIGKEMRAGRMTAVTKRRAQTEERTRRETVKPTRTRSDATAERRPRREENSAAARRKRLEDVQL